MKTLTILSVLCLANFCDPKTMPPTFTKCDKRKIDFDDYLSEAIKNAITQLDKPMEQYHLPSLEPLFVPLILPNVDMAPYSVSKFKNFKIFGHTKITDLKATMNFENKMLTIAITNPEMRYESDYETKSIMFFKLIDTSGAALVTTQNVTNMFTFTFEEYTRDNQDYLLVIDSKLEVAPQSVKIHFDNLFKDKILNEGFNRELSADWKKTFVHFGPIYFDNFAQAYGNVFNRFLEKVPLTDLFDGV